MGRGTVRIHGGRPLQGTHCKIEFALFLQHLAHQDVGPCRSRVEPDGTLQQALSIFVFLNSRIRVGQCSEQGKEKITIQTGAGLKTCALILHSDWEYEFEIEMGEAVIERELALKMRAGEVRGIPVSMGNPHYVVFVPEFAGDWQAHAAEIQLSSHFKQGVNVELVAVDSKHDVRARFFERGVGETQSSGTGSCAAAAAAMATGRADSPVKVHAPGGTQGVRREGNNILLRGPARLVCRGEFFLS